VLCSCRANQYTTPGRHGQRRQQRRLESKDVGQRRAKRTTGLPTPKQSNSGKKNKDHDHPAEHDRWTHLDLARKHHQTTEATEPLSPAFLSRDDVLYSRWHRVDHFTEDRGTGAKPGPRGFRLIKQTVKNTITSQPTDNERANVTSWGTSIKTENNNHNHDNAGPRRGLGNGFRTRGDRMKRILVLEGFDRKSRKRAKFFYRGAGSTRFTGGRFTPGLL